MSARKKPVGWRGESARHSAARKGIKTRPVAILGMTEDARRGKQLSEAEVAYGLLALDEAGENIRRRRDRIEFYLGEEAGYETAEERRDAEAEWKELDKELERVRDEVVELRGG